MIAMSKKAHKLVTCLRLQGGSKKFIQQGHSQFPARSVLPVREHRKLARTLLVAFFNRPRLFSGEIPVDSNGYGQCHSTGKPGCIMKERALMGWTG